jgi:hypothetical protein
MELLFYSPDFNTFKDIYLNLYLPYSFPTNLLFENEFKTNSEIIKEIQSRYSNVEWIELPTTLYELLVLFLYEDSKGNPNDDVFSAASMKKYIEDFNNNKTKIKLDFYLDIDKDISSNKALIDKISSFLTNTNFIEACFDINERIFKIINVRFKIAKNDALNLALVILSKLNNKQICSSSNNFGNKEKPIINQQLHFDVIEKCISLNYNINEYTFLLYRTSVLNHNSTVFLKKNQPCSVSFSMSLFGGIIFDPTACSFCLFYNKHKGLYVWNISKFSINKYSPLFIPPLNTFMCMIRVGEYSHPRFKNVVVEEEEMYDRNYKIRGLAYTFEDVLEYKCKDKSPIECQKELEQIFQEFKNNVIVISDNTNTLTTNFNTTNPIYQKFLKILNN